ncbi:hypothetical protein ACX80S_03975 [Arthrobacter sp. RHLT1-20]
MPILDELQGLFEIAGVTPYDMRSEGSKSICVKLTAFSWKFLAPYDGGKPPWFEASNYSPFFRVEEMEYAARIYELMWYANLAYIAGGNQILLDTAARKLETEAHTGKVPTRSNLILRGCVEYRRGNFQLAKHFISRAHHELIPDSVISPFFAYSRSSCLFEEPYRGSAEDSAGESADGSWLLVAGDAKYIARFLPNYVDSMVRNGAHELLGLHVRFIATAETEHLRESVESVLREAQLVLGERMEVSEVCAPAVRDTRSWFAAERFVHAKELLAVKERLIITDLDYGLSAHPADFVEWSKKFDVCGLLARDDEFKSFFPWLKIQAGTVVVANTAVGHYFLEKFGRYFETSFVGSGWNWGIDQNALANAHDNLAGRAALGNINDVVHPFYIPRDLKKAAV